MLAVDIGGTKFAAGLVSMRGELLDRAVVLVDQNVGPEAHFKALAGIVEQQLAAAERHGVRVACVGVGSAGPITRHCETVSPVNLPAWREFPLRARAQRADRRPRLRRPRRQGAGAGRGMAGRGQGLSTTTAC